jgi:hypothetical protein
VGGDQREDQGGEDGEDEGPDMSNILNIIGALFGGEGQSIHAVPSWRLTILTPPPPLLSSPPLLLPCSPPLLFFPLIPSNLPSHNPTPRTATPRTFTPLQMRSPHPRP